MNVEKYIKQLPKGVRLFMEHGAKKLGISLQERVQRDIDLLGEEHMLRLLLIKEDFGNITPQEWFESRGYPLD